MLRGNFYEVSSSASSYRGELLGLAALHYLLGYLQEYYKIGEVRGKICCDNVSALGKAS